ncbi:MAG: LysR family transcriptional regulator [Pseudomonadota bacterium]
MDIKQLRYFVAIVEDGSFSAAASRIGIAQPSLSQHLKNLEQQLGVDLLVRSARGVTVTDAGEVLFTHARQIVEDVERAKDEVSQLGREPYGRVSFGLPSSVSMVLSVPLAETVRQEAPKISLRAVESMSGHIREWLQDHSVDLGILYEVNTLRNMHLRLLLTEDLHFVSAPDAWPLKSEPGRPVKLVDFSRLDLVLPSLDHGLRAMIERFAKVHDIRLNVVVEMDSLSQIKTLVARGSAFTILAPAACQDMVAAGHLVSSPVVSPAMRRPVYLVRNPEKVMNRATREVERMTITVIRDLILRGIWPGNLADTEEEL